MLNVSLGPFFFFFFVAEHLTAKLTSCVQICYYISTNISTQVLDRSRFSLLTRRERSISAS